MGMKMQDIYNMMDRFETSGIARLKLAWDNVELELERATAPVVVAAPTASVQAPVAVAPQASGQTSEPAAVASASANPGTPESAQGTFITAPLVGTFYAAPAPDKPPYVQPGDTVKKGDTVCLLEAMKMMSEVVAPCDCVIEEIMVADGELCSFDAPLIRYRAL